MSLGDTTVTESIEQVNSELALHVHIHVTVTPTVRIPTGLRIAPITFTTTQQVVTGQPLERPTVPVAGQSSNRQPTAWVDDREEVRNSISQGFSEEIVLRGALRDAYLDTIFDNYFYTYEDEVDWNTDWA
ncbi:hypothetical protein HWV62_867 [Athelia sp. TMB]|nr:hypothetical protein HWV62_867 [Athelia sp. TMB]